MIALLDGPDSTFFFDARASLLADDGAVAVEQVEHALGHAGFLEHFHQKRAADRGLLSGLHDDGVAGDE